MASVVAVRVTRGLLMGGTLMFVACWSCLCVGRVGRVGALLGPEGTRVGQVLVTGVVGGVVLVRDHRGIHISSCVLRVLVVLWRWFRVLFENCTVDASIFVAKFLRAHGGCLGTRSR